MPMSPRRLADDDVCERCREHPWYTRIQDGEQSMRICLWCERELYRQNLPVPVPSRSRRLMTPWRER